MKPTTLRGLDAAASDGSAQDRRGGPASTSRPAAAHCHSSRAGQPTASPAHRCATGGDARAHVLVGRAGRVGNVRRRRQEGVGGIERRTGAYRGGRSSTMDAHRAVAPLCKWKWDKQKRQRQRQERVGRQGEASRQEGRGWSGEGGGPNRCQRHGHPKRARPRLAVSAPVTAGGRGEKRPVCRQRPPTNSGDSTTSHAVPHREGSHPAGGRTYA